MERNATKKNWNMNFTEEELKTAIGHLQLDLRGNWGWDYKERLEELIDLLNQLRRYSVPNPKDFDLEVNDFEINILIRTAQGEIDEPSDGRIFRGGYLYGYESEEGRTQNVYNYLKNVLSYPDENNIELSLLYKRDQKLNDLGICD
jgi:hypothetical protein